MACKDCPFKIENTLKYKVNIYDDVKEKNRGKAHYCHTNKKYATICSGFLQEAFDRDDRSILIDAYERADYVESIKIKEMIKELDIKHYRDF